MELTFEPSFTKTHNIHQIILSLPNKEGLIELWRQVPSLIHEYTQIMYKGLNQNFGMLTINVFFSKQKHFVGKCPAEFFLDHKEDVKECIRIAKTFIQTCEDIVNTAEDNPPKHEEPRRSDYTEPPRPRNTNSSSSRPTYVNPNPQYVSSSSSSGAIGRSYSSSSGSLSFSGGRTSSSSGGGGGGGFLALK